jgi:hypothetical protein
VQTESHVNSAVGHRASIDRVNSPPVVFGQHTYVLCLRWSCSAGCGRSRCPDGWACACLALACARLPRASACSALVPCCPRPVLQQAPRRKSSPVS